jgi:glycosyltransferase involved in cell wall biosynthesis
VKIHKHNKIIILSSVNLSVNPRALKELLAASKLFDKVIFVGFDIKGWTTKTETAIKEQLPSNIQTIYLSATRKPFMVWFIATVIQKLTQLLYSTFGNNIKINAYASNKRSYSLKNYLNKNREKLKDADLVIAHTLATLYPAYSFCSKHKISFGFDVEDYHPGEYIKNDITNEIKRREFLMQKIIPHTTYLTYASPLIGEKTISLTKFRGMHALINNSFFSQEFNVSSYKNKINIHKDKINLVWFSQNISFGRGLEIFLPVLDKLENCHLYLIGSLNSDFDKKYTISKHHKISVLGVLSQPDLHAALTQFDIGLALDYSEKDLNRQLALTNKIFAYYQAGLYIFAFNTPAQKIFIEEYNCGILADHKNENNVMHAFRYISNNISEIREFKKERQELSKIIAWENEVSKLYDLWNKTLKA